MAKRRQPFSTPTDSQPRNLEKDRRRSADDRWLPRLNHGDLPRWLGVEDALRAPCSLIGRTHRSSSVSGDRSNVVVGMKSTVSGNPDAPAPSGLITDVRVRYRCDKAHSILAVRILADMCAFTRAGNSETARSTRCR